MILLVINALVDSTAALDIRGPDADASQFRVTSFVTGLDYPIGMETAPDGSLLVLVNAGSSFFSASGQILRFRDVDLDGMAEGPGEILYSGLPPAQTCLRKAGSLLLVGGTGGGRLVSILRMQSDRSLPLTGLSLAGNIDLILPAGSWLHPVSALAVRPNPNHTNAWDMVFQLGSDANFRVTTRTGRLASETVPGAIGEIRGDALHMITLHDEGTQVRASDLIQIATGLRNAAGMAFHPVTGDLWFQDNGIDGLQDPNEPTSADELNVLSKDRIGGEIEHFGFPQSYTEYRTGRAVGEAGIKPVVSFTPIPDSMTGAESEGPNDITFAPPGFPEALASGLFVGFHGRFSRGGIQNEENPVVHVNTATGIYFHFIPGQQEGLGHPDGLLSTADSLFVADLSPPGSLSAGRGKGVVYQIKSLAAPRLTWRQTGNELELSWSHGYLQMASSPQGPWAMVTGANQSPYRRVSQQPLEFFRATTMTMPVPPKPPEL